MNIFKANPDDAEELLNIYKPYVEKTAISFEYEVPSEEEFRQRIIDISSKYPYLKAVDEEGYILGYAYAATFKSRSAYDWSVETTIYLREDCKGNGIGRALYERLEKDLLSMGILNMNACIAVPRELNASENGEASIYVSNDSYFFHKHMGFELIGRFHDSGYKFNNWFDMIWMEKLIGEHTSNVESPKFGVKGED